MCRIISVIAKDADMHRKDKQIPMYDKSAFSCEIWYVIYLFFILFSISESFFLKKFFLLKKLFLATRCSL